VRAHHLVEALALLFALGAPDRKGRARASLSIRLMSRLLRLQRVVVARRRSALARALAWRPATWHY
jgi:hypothetical protein